MVKLYSYTGVYVRVDLPQHFFPVFYIYAMADRMLGGNTRWSVIYSRLVGINGCGSNRQCFVRLFELPVVNSHDVFLHSIVRREEEIQVMDSCG